MRIDHVAIWTSQLERLKDFYVKYFQWNRKQQISEQGQKF